MDSQFHYHRTTLHRTEVDCGATYLVLSTHSLSCRSSCTHTHIHNESMKEKQKHRRRRSWKKKEEKVLKPKLFSLFLFASWPDDATAAWTRDEEEEWREVGRGKGRGKREEARDVYSNPKGFLAVKHFCSTSLWAWQMYKSVTLYGRARERERRGEEGREGGR